MQVSFKHYIRNYICNYSALLILLFLGMAVYLYAPGLFEHRTPVFADSIVNGLPILDFHSRILHENLPALWTDKIYGGYPLQAEGQVALAHPPNIAIAWLFDPLLGQNIYHFMCVVLSAVGVFGLCRSLGASVAAASFSMFAVAFSTLWLKTQANISVAGTVMWIPWLFWAMEFWYRAPSLRRAALFAAATALIILAGYPHAFHGSLIFMGLALLLEFLSRRGRKRFSERWRTILVTGAAAMLLCAGIAMVQWAPLLELVGQSHRQEGTAVGGIFPAQWVYRGLLYSLMPVDVTTPFAPSTGSFLVCVLASVSVLVKLPLRVKCYIIPTLFLLQLGMGPESALFRFLYDNQLVPGMHYFRIMYIYFYPAIVGLAVLAAFALDGLANRFPDATSVVPKKYLLWATAALGLFWLGACFNVHTADVPILHYVAVAVLAVAGWLCYRHDRRELIPVVAVLIIAAECAVLRMHPFRFVDQSLLGEPASVKALRAQAYNLTDFKLKNTTMASVYTFGHPSSPGLERGVQTMLEAVAASTNMLWDIASPNGTFGLATARMLMTEQAVMRELNGQSATAPGARLIDSLSYGYITTRRPFPAQGLETIYQNPDLGILVQQNSYALPRIQFYPRAQFVDSPEVALATIQQLRTPMLVVEGEAKGRKQVSADAVVDITILRQEPDNYQIEVAAPEGGWLFISDANYPGWKADIDGESTPVLSAQVMGKAMYIPPGTHLVRVFFESVYFTIGLVVSIASLLVMLVMLVARPRPG